ncbi:adenosylcobinamide-GDP ribazoletransferase [Clostridium algidicarnis]|uniref:Adenosylcobinamide-GDP ribazoletransferase n=2 Tax=Clostridium algidicarnis TaxID=37659 RepID=A0A2S6FXE0_9CLOT|nr:adenosylcobinamide-GDP ribazoletransferase [Clostridium algidicarnis]MBB6697667.1 adenosylcobinamide-GDP ribazoletransferase [Clostridium algidicarnis]MBU3206213.1 adenosylcobinamide-GDP ribazoletransferase [Clostridium algidicarnis]MBU3220042.1 adenosylcobinamide-GDP ribazoletransferase [Clostridium algidicarnis]MCB2285853.1 adenosylcobinamide-GDP ribazoletransferase [Clostridium algidicarnis]PPK48211.1 cobalamin-5'-phosphate synthase [Clostridium algidicarnis DSM 15099]
MEEVKSFLLMIQFMTRIPINKALPCENKNFKKASAYIPLIGIIVGMSQFIVYKLLFNLIPAEFLSVIMIIVYVFITGGFHLDGLGDTCDGFFAFKGGKDKIIEIMKDSRVGTYSTIAVIIDILIRYIAYVKIININSGYIIILAPFVGRVSLALLAYVGKGAKEEGSGNLIINNISNREMGIIFIIVAIFSYVTSGYLHVTYEILLFGISCIVTLLFYKLCKDKIEGITGDNLGAINEIVELVALIFLLSI